MSTISSRQKPLRLAFCVLMLSASSAFAQNQSVVEASGGYQYLLDVNDDVALTLYSNGLFASVGWNATSRLTLVGEFTRSATVIGVGESARFGPIDSEIYTTMGGVRFRSGGFFVQALIGQLALRSRREQLLGTLEDTLIDIAVQPGVGFDVGVTRRVSVRIMGDYRRPLSDTGTFAHQFRIAAGVVVGIGTR